MRSIITLLILLAAQLAQAAATIHFSDTASLLAPQVISVDRYLSAGCGLTSPPYTLQWKTTSTSAIGGTGKQSGHTPPNGASAPCDIQNSASSNQYMWWVTPPLSAGFTISGTITPTACGAESVAQMNAGIKFLIYKWDGARGGIILSTGNVPMLDSNISTELGGSLACGTTTTTGSNPTSTTFVTGDRIVFIPRLDQASGQGNAFSANGSREADICYNGANIGVNDTRIAFTETLTFNADTSAQTSDWFQMSNYDPWWIVKADLKKMASNLIILKPEIPRYPG